VVTFRAYTHWIFLHPILRHCNKKMLQHLTIFSSRFLMTNQGKLLKTLTYLGLSFVKSLPRLVIETYDSNLSIYFYLFIAIVCAKISSVYKPLTSSVGKNMLCPINECKQPNLACPNPCTKNFCNDTRN